MNPRDIYRDAISTFGAQMQLIKMREELGELQTAMAKYELGIEPIGAVVEELADVIITTSQARLILGVRPVDAIIRFKLERLADKIDVVWASRIFNGDAI